MIPVNVSYWNYSGKHGQGVKEERFIMIDKKEPGLSTRQTTTKGGYRGDNINDVGVGL